MENLNYVIIIGIILFVALLVFLTLNNKIKQKNTLIENQKSKINELSEFQQIVDAKSEAEKIINEAKNNSQLLIQDANVKSSKLLQDANTEIENLKNKNLEELEIVREEINEIKNQNKELIEKTKEDSNTIKNDALRQSTQIISDAEAKAREISGEAYEYAKNAEKNKAIALAMQNLINGYGDKYIKPSYLILDDLADDFSFTDAGKKLKDAREYTKLLMMNKETADCDYVENIRRNTAIDFVTDAFNGKVDSVLTMIKKDNYGTLEQKIKDAFSIVNRLGQPFRNARITNKYLDARLQELKWGNICNELKIKEQEEQRQIKEQMREEERAKREYEKAMKEAARDEETLKKAMVKAQEEVSKASEDQKAKYEAKLLDLEQRLKEAEEKNQRALSMAQQTKLGHVYIISNIGSFGEDVFKIGMTRRLEPLDRVRELGDASVPFPFDVHAMIYSDDAPQLENNLHKFFVRNRVNKVNSRKEFFRVGISDIKNEIEKMGIQAKWTMLAQSEEYKETLEIEKSMTDKIKENEWLKSQSEIVNENDE